MNIPKLHLITQYNQPLGSQCKCCEKCGVAIFALKDDRYVEEMNEYTREIAKANKLIRCVD